MKSKGFIAATVLLILAFLSPLLPACSTAEAADNYTIVIPSVLQAGTEQAVSVALFKDNQPIPGKLS